MRARTLRLSLSALFQLLRLGYKTILAFALNAIPFARGVVRLAINIRSSLRLTPAAVFEQMGRAKLPGRGRDTGPNASQYLGATAGREMPSGSRLAGQKTQKRDAH